MPFPFDPVCKWEPAPRTHQRGEASPIKQPHVVIQRWRGGETRFLRSYGVCGQPRPCFHLLRWRSALPHQKPSSASRCVTDARFAALGHFVSEDTFQDVDGGGSSHLFIHGRRMCGAYRAEHQPHEPSTHSIEKLLKAPVWNLLLMLNSIFVLCNEGKFDLEGGEFLAYHNTKMSALHFFSSQLYINFI